MSATHATIDLDDVEGLLAADREGLLRAASMAGAQMRPPPPRWTRACSIG